MLSGWMDVKSSIQWWGCLRVLKVMMHFWAVANQQARPIFDARKVKYRQPARDSFDKAQHFSGSKVPNPIPRGYSASRYSK